ncbi:MAG: GlsB/YeaQ/YmgE family stress response membrane protein [Anaerolineae bacterium]|nr:GlsB/YeaQ/YmgE family stress response membrane protein [Anaerolineae bacterium]
MGIVSWIIFGGLAGWVASLVTGRNERQGCLMNIIVGIVGAFIGGFLVELLGGGEMDFSFDLTSFIVAVVGAVVLLFLVGLLQRRT